MPYSQAATYIPHAPRISAGADGLIHVAANAGRPPAAMPRNIAIAYGRALFAAIAELEDRDAAAEEPAQLRAVG